MEARSEQAEQALDRRVLEMRRSLMLRLETAIRKFDLLARALHLEGVCLTLYVYKQWARVAGTVKRT